MAHSEEWAIGYVGGWKKAETGEEAVSQWSTLPSGPLARVERPEKGRNRGKSHELVDDSFEWTTSWAGKHGKGRNRGKSHEPVVHSVEWTTSRAGKHGKRAKPWKKS